MRGFGVFISKYRLVQINKNDATRYSMDAQCVFIVATNSLQLISCPS